MFQNICVSKDLCFKRSVFQNICVLKDLCFVRSVFYKICVSKEMCFKRYVLLAKSLCSRRNVPNSVYQTSTKEY